MMGVMIHTSKMEGPVFANGKAEEKSNRSVQKLGKVFKFLLF
jgi:hypothetical protein